MSKNNDIITLSEATVEYSPTPSPFTKETTIEPNSISSTNLEIEYDPTIKIIDLLEKILLEIKETKKLISKKGAKKAAYD